MFTLVLLAISHLALFFVAIRWHYFYYWALALGYIILLVAHWQLFGQTFTSRRSQIALITLTSLYFPAGLVLLTINGPNLQRFWVLVLGVGISLIALALKNVSTTRQNPSYALEQLIGQLVLVSVFLTSICGLAVMVILNWSLAFVTLVLGAVSGGLFALTLRVYSLPWPRVLVGSVAIFILIMEIFVIVTLWPTTFYTLSALITLTFYVLTGLIRQYFLFGSEGFTTKINLRYILVSVIGLLLVLLTSRWS